MEPESSLPCSQKPAIFPYPEAGDSRGGLYSVYRQVKKVTSSRYYNIKSELLWILVTLNIAAIAKKSKALERQSYIL
jgi:hypothetical protein